MICALTNHAVDRWVERVDPHASRAAAGMAIVAFLRDAEVTFVPDREYGPIADRGALFASNAAYSGVLVVIDPIRRKAMTVRTITNAQPAPARRSIRRDSIGATP